MNLVFVSVSDRFFCLSGPKLAFTMTGADFTPLLCGETRVPRRHDAEKNYCPLVELVFRRPQQNQPTDYAFKGVMPRADDVYLAEIWDSAGQQVAKTLSSGTLRKTTLTRADNQHPIGEMVGPRFGLNRRFVNAHGTIGHIRKIPFWRATEAVRKQRKRLGASSVYSVEPSADEEVDLWVVAWALMVCSRHSIDLPMLTCG